VLLKETKRKIEKINKKRKSIKVTGKKEKKRKIIFMIDFLL